MSHQVGIPGAPDWTTFAPRVVEPRSARKVVEPGPMYDDIIRPLRPFTGMQLSDLPDARPAVELLPENGDLDRAKTITAAAQDVLAELTTEQRQRVTHETDAVEWQQWLNSHPNILRHGLILEDLTEGQRGRVIALMRESLSEAGFTQARDIMRINGLLGEITGRAEEFGEWPYFFSLFGDPSIDEPWGWQLDGHHLDLNVVVVDGHVVTTPAFMGSEPCAIRTGPLAGTEVMRAEHEAGLRFMRSLDPAAAAIATARSSILTADLPSELLHPISGRALGGPFGDNIVLSSEGLPASDLSPAQRTLLLELISTYLGWSPDSTAAIRRALCAEYLDETSFLWMGRVSDAGPFFYRVLSPAVMIEFDHHAGTAFDNPEPTANHIHSLVRTPRKGDYGVDLIQRHYERFDHSSGGHRPWT
ncbi:hypothetical protein ASC77_18690 [Nocardioides sp. Root1257]|uniref:DUF3500 domain-containing protein n=1 Tax=unclassified Nocardioides TaxID=2615069 RepID=UPI0006F95983|nr:MULTISPECIES: DUF3500 domain-containing protein [unclassified Nocardioides]KQW45942.1 hypothetical protein ASC77_18690 [Nocardioides sp. Root1257]KRC43206.1 hypothetical protein ASE24_19655 [Nocardioides sp. Root224]